MAATRTNPRAVQARSVATRERLLDAGAEVLKQRGYEAFTLADVAAAANVAVGSIYQRIGNKEDLLLALYEREMSRISQETAEGFDVEAIAALPLEAAVREAVAAFARICRRHGPFLRVAIAQSMVNPTLKRRGSRRSRELGEAFKAVLDVHRDAYRHPDPATAIDVCFRLTFSTLVRRTTHGPTFESAYRLSEDALVDNLTAACLGLLMATSLPSRSQRGC